MKVKDLPENEDICKYQLKVPSIIKRLISSPLDTAYLVRCSPDGKGIYISPDPPTNTTRICILVEMIPTQIFHWDIISGDAEGIYESATAPSIPPDTYNRKVW